MFATLTAKLVAAGAVIAMLACGMLWFGSHERGIGAAGIQAKWDAEKLSQASVAANAKAANAAQVLDWTKQFSAIGATYEANTHVHAPKIADTVASGVADGSVRLRDGADVCPGSGSTAQASGHAGSVDVAAAAAATQRLADSVAAVRVGDAADAREQQLREQVMALQAVVRAEREH